MKLNFMKKVSSTLHALSFKYQKIYKKSRVLLRKIPEMLSVTEIPLALGVKRLGEDQDRFLKRE